MHLPDYTVVGLQHLEIGPLKVAFKHGGRPEQQGGKALLDLKESIPRPGA